MSTDPKYLTFGKLAADGIKMNFIESSYNQTACTRHLMLMIDFA